LRSFQILLFWVVPVICYGQTHAEMQIQSVFDQLVFAYGNAKSPPQLRVIQGQSKQVTPAIYNTDQRPIIIVDAHLVSIFRSFGKDSLNALSVVISHELAHYYSDHTFCSDYAYALKDQSKSLSDALKSVSKQEKISKETEADQKGFFYAAAAGYSPFDVQSSVLEKIYDEYLYPDNLSGYPTKQQRISIALTAEKKAKELYDPFEAGLEFLKEKDYKKAIEAFEEANSYIPFRENFNNMGVARALMALDLKDPEYLEKEYPDRFLYPLESDNASRLMKEIERGIDYSKEDQILDLLKAAKTNFQEAIRLDPGYVKSYINLACAFDLTGNPEAAIGIIKELPSEKQKTREALRILAIAYFHAKREKEAEEIWNELDIK
jgi:tetratricopeptide (TPR) repeat protein